MIVQKAASSSGDSPGPAANTNGMGSQQEEERFGDTGEAAGEGGEVPLGSPLLAEGSEEEEEEEEEGEGYGEDEEEEEDEDEEMADLEDIEDLEEVEEEEVLPKGRCYGKRPAGGNGTNHLQQPSQGTSVTEEAVAGDGDKVEEEQEQREEQTPLPRHKKMRVSPAAAGGWLYTQSALQHACAATHSLSCMFPRKPMFQGCSFVVHSGHRCYVSHGQGPAIHHNTHKLYVVLVVDNRWVDTAPSSHSLVFE
jgi:hypothetical protein